MSEADRGELASWLRLKRLPQALGVRARIVALSAEGHTLREIAERRGNPAHGMSVAAALSGLGARRAQKPASKRATAQDQSAQGTGVVAATMRPPKNATHWSARRRKEVGVSFMTVHRIWQKYGLQPHRVESFKVQHQPRVRRQVGRHRGAPSGSAGAGADAVRG